MRKALQAIAMIAVMFTALAGGSPAWAQGSRKDDIVFDAQGKPMAGATVRVCTANATGEPCSPLANIYSDEALTQAMANPTTTDGLGNYHFYAAPGRYMIEISGPGIETKQIPDVILPNDPSSPTFASLTTTSGISAFSLTLSGNLTVNGNASVSGTLTGGSITATALKPAGTSGDCAKWGSGGTLGDAGAPCGSSGSPAFSSVTSGTNTTAAMTVGTGASIGVSGTGSVTATKLSPAGTAGDCVKWGTSGALGDTGAACGSGGGGDAASANDAIQYGSGNSTAGTGLQISAPEPYLSNMVSNLFADGGGTANVFGQYGHGSTVALDSSCTSLKFLATGDPNYASPPSCMYDGKTLSLVGKSGVGGDQTSWMPPDTPLSGCVSTAGTVCLQFQGYGNYVKGIGIQYPSTAVQIGGTSDGSTGSCPATGDTVLDDDHFSDYNTPGTAAFGPTVLISCNTLWTRIANSSIGGNLAQTSDPTLRAAIYVSPTGASGFSGLDIFENDGFTGGAGIVFHGGTGGTSSFYGQHLTEEGSSGQTCQALITATSADGYIGRGVGDDLVTSDCNPQPPAMAVDHAANPEIYTLMNSGIPEGSMTLFGDSGDYPTNTIFQNMNIPVARVYPSAKNDKGEWAGHDLNDVADVWRSGVPQIVRFAQSSNMTWSSASWNLTDMGTGNAVSAVTDPWQQSGKGDAWNFSCTANGTSGCWVKISQPTITFAAGDYLILSDLVQPSSDNGLTNAGYGQLALEFPFGSNPAPRFIASGGGGTVSSGGFSTHAAAMTDGHWQREWIVVQALKAGSFAAKLTIGYDAAHPINVAAPMLLHLSSTALPIESPCTVSALSESGNTASVTTTAACNVVEGQPFIIAGSSTTGWNSSDVNSGGSALTDATAGLFVVKSVTDSTHFTFYMPSTGLSAASDGSIIFTNDSEAAELARTLTYYPPSCAAGQWCNAAGAAPQLGASQTWAGTNTITGSVTPSGGTVTATNVTPAGTSGNCVEWGASGALSDAGSPCGTSSGNVSGPSSSTDGDVTTFSGTTGKVIQDSGVAGANLVTASANYNASGDLVQAAGANKATSDSGVVAANVNTNSSAFTSGDLVKAGGSHTTSDSGIAASAVTQTIASGTAALGTSAISSGTCASVVTVAATGVATTDVVTAGFNGDPTSTTGYLPSTSGMLTIIAYPTAGNVNFKVCNNTSSSVTPGAVTLNWRVVR